MKLMNMPCETWAFVSRRTGLDRNEINATLQRAFEHLTEKIARAGIRARGKPRAHFHYRDGQEVGFDIGFPIDPADEGVAREAGLTVGETPPGEALVHIHRGTYASLGETYRQMERRITGQGLKSRGDLWELYLSDPDECPTPNLLTRWSGQSRGEFTLSFEGSADVVSNI